MRNLISAFAAALFAASVTGVELADNPADFGGSAYVVPSGCHRGGSLDLRLDGTHFP